MAPLIFSMGAFEPPKFISVTDLRIHFYSIEGGQKERRGDNIIL
jgi:hypothetical protein